MSLDSIRARLAYLALAALIGAAALAFLLGDQLSGVQLTLLTMIVTQIAGKASAAFSYFFDGVAGAKPAEPPAPATAPAPVPAPGAEP